MLKSFRQIVATARKWPGRKSASRPCSSRLDPRPEARRVQLFRRRGEDDVDAGAFGERRGRVARRAGSARSRRPDENCASLTKRLMTTWSFSRARGLEQRHVSGVERAHRRDEADVPSARAARISAIVRTTFMARVASASATYIGSRSGASSWIARTCASTVSQSPRAIGPVRSKPFSIVRVISGTSASGGAPAASNRRRRGAVQRDEVVRRDRGARVVERARVVVEVERPQPERQRRARGRARAPRRSRR